MSCGRWWKVSHLQHIALSLRGGANNWEQVSGPEQAEWGWPSNITRITVISLPQDPVSSLHYWPEIGISFWFWPPPQQLAGGWEINTSVLGSPLSAVAAVRACQSSSLQLNNNIIFQGGPLPGAWTCHSQVPPIPLRGGGARSLPETAQHFAGQGINVSPSLPNSH